VDKEKRATRWDLYRTIRELRKENESLEAQVMLLVEELAKRDKTIATLRGEKNV
jgi:hypothetical protein